MRTYPPTLTVRASRTRPGQYVICNAETGTAVEKPRISYKGAARDPRQDDASYFRSEEQARDAIPRWIEQAQANAPKPKEPKPAGARGWKRGTFSPAMRREDSADGDRLPLKCYTHPDARGLVIHRAFTLDDDGFFEELPGSWAVSQAASGLSVTGRAYLPNAEKAKAMALEMAAVRDFTAAVGPTEIPETEAGALRAIIGRYGSNSRYSTYAGR